MKKIIGLTVGLFASSLAVFAGPVTPTYTTIGSIPGATFGGTGNPDTSVAITTITDGAETITLGLQGQQRYFNPVLTESGGVYTATPGANYGNPATPSTPHTPSSFLGATWDFDFYIGVTGPGAALNNFTYELLYGTDASSLLTINPLAISDNAVTGTTAQNSENLLFGNFGGVPNTLAFNPNANGIYSFELEAFDGGNLVGTSAINVKVGAVPDASSNALLLGLGVLSLAAVAYRQNRTQLAK